jgi:hypothetical protein
MKNHFLLLLLSVLLFSCSTSKKVEKPTESYLPDTVSLPPSFITIPIETSVADLEKILNKQISGLIYEDNSLDDNGGDNLMVKAWKLGDIRLNLNDNVLSYSVPLKLWIKAGWKISKFGFEVSDYREVDAAIALKFKSTITLNPDWTVKSVTVADGYEWISSPVLKVGPVDVPITFIANLILKANQAKLSAAIDKSVKENISLKSYISAAWDALQQPRKVNDTYNMWVKVMPEAILSNPLSGKDGKILHTVSIKAVTQAFVGEEPAKSPKTSLPALSIQNKIPSEFSINMYTELPFPKINEFAREYMLGQIFTEGKYSIKVENIDLYGSNDKLVIHLVLSGSYKGDLYLEGLPFYNAEIQAIQLKNLDYHVKTKDILIKSAAWIFKSKMLNTLSQNISLPMGEQLKAARTMTESNFKDNILAEGVFLNAKLKDFDILDIGLSKESMRCLVGINGRLSLSIRP